MSSPQRVTTPAVTPRSPLLRRAATAVLLSTVALAPGCSSGPETPKVVVYCALDQVFAEPLLARFERETGLRVEARYDVEASKTVGLVNSIRAEAGFTRCDVFWNNEFAHTVALGEEGLLASYDSPSAAEIPELFRDPQRRWTGFAARARILIVNTELVSPEELASIDSMQDLVDERWRGRTCIARPLTGTTLTHVVALYERLGSEATDRWLDAIEERGVNLTSGNATDMRLVREGKAAFGWTDTDDFNVAREAGFPVVAVYPAQTPDDGAGEPLGTLVVPNTLAILANAPHPEEARRLVDWLLRPEVEAELAASRSAQVPVRPNVPRPAHVKVPGVDFVPMPVDYRAIGRAMPEHHEKLKERFLE